uniref:EF-hand domain-containing protein n=1 Tax=Meloidogyne javanica TaxID=6303 RepID=A0A915N9R9_MELJA
MHLEDQMEIGEKKMTQDQERYHYFTMADSNKDGFIDGVEVFKAIHHDHENGDHPASQSDNEIEEKVDGVLEAFDLDAALAKFGEKSEVYDESHLKLHVEEEIGENKKMNEEDERFHYFDIHDSNKDSHIDGIELWKAVHHNHKDELEEIRPEDEIEKLVDEAFKEIDLDGDGLISYPEYLKKLS